MKTTINPSSQRAILDLLKQLGPIDAGKLASELELTAMAVRQHLYSLEEQGLVTFELQPRPKGRPAKLWRLTQRSDPLFPDAHARLTVGLIEAMKETFGAEGLDKLLATRKQHLIDAYRPQVPSRGSLRKQVEALADIRSAEGYMAGVESLGKGAWLLVENHCAICLAAAQCQGFCKVELDVFQKVLGPRAIVRREEFIQAGARRCTYRIEPMARKDCR